MIPQILSITGEASDSNFSFYGKDSPEELIEKRLQEIYGISLNELAPMMGGKFGDWFNKQVKSVTKWYDGQQEGKAKEQAMQEFMMMQQNKKPGIDPMILGIGGAAALLLILLMRK